MSVSVSLVQHMKIAYITYPHSSSYIHTQSRVHNIIIFLHSTSTAHLLNLLSPYVLCLTGTVVTPVHDGWAEVKGISRSKVGGRYMDAFLLQVLEQQQNLSKPLYKLHKTLNAVTGEVEVTDNAAFLSGPGQGKGGSGTALRVHPSYDAYMYLEMARYLLAPSVYCICGVVFMTMSRQLAGYMAELCGLLN